MTDDPCPCGPSSWKCSIPFLFRAHVPQFVFKPACEGHDAAYTQGGTPTDRKIADDTFYATMKAEIAAKPFTQRFYLYPMAYLYYRAVRNYGAQYFRYTTV